MIKNAAVIVVNAVVKVTSSIKKELKTMSVWAVILNNDWWL